MTTARASVLAAALAALVYVTALGNRFALDDGPIIERNPAAHSVRAALAAFGQPYWPAERGAGQWRPLVILSFAADWSLADGSLVLHASNVLWHAAATALLVPLLAAYVPVTAALAGAMVFAVHPVHVEAVANLVGRAELMVAVFLFTAILLSRAVRRRRAAGRAAWRLEAGLLLAVAAALLSKEHAAVGVALLALDDLATRRELPAGLPWRDYAAVVALTAAWLLLRRHVESGLSFQTVAPTFFGLGTVGRISTMLPVAFVLVRLLVWPFDLSPSYHPRVVERLEHPTLEGLAGLLLLSAVLALAFLTWRRHRAVSAGLFLTGIAWLPTANFLFPTGIVIAERTLYIAAAGVALIAAAGAESFARRKSDRAATLAAILVCAPLASRTVSAIPAWKSNRDLVLGALASHPESYWIHESAARALRRLEQLEPAFREYRLAAELYPLDHLLLTEIAAVELDAGHPRLALNDLRRAEHLDSRYTLTQQLLAQALLQLDSAPQALDHARAAVSRTPRRAAAVEVLAASFLALGARDSALAAWTAFGRRGGPHFERWLHVSATYAALGVPDSARLALDSALVAMPQDSTAFAQVRQAERLVRRARPPAR